MVQESRGMILVTGASGYIGGQLVPALLKDGWDVRVLVRDPERIAQEPWQSAVDVLVGDINEPQDVSKALAGVATAYYLVHSMSGGDFVTKDRELATAFAAAAAEASVSRIVYLGGLHPEGTPLSEHMASRKEVGEIFLDSPTPTTVLQASVVLGDGSASFEMLRYLTERLPVMVAPQWLKNRLQPVAINDAIRALVAVNSLPTNDNRTYDLAGPDVLTYAELIQTYAHVSGLRPRVIATVPVLSPRLASHWVGLITPVAADLAQPLVESLIHESVATENDLNALLDPPLSTTVPAAIGDALTTVQPDTAFRRAGWIAAAALLAALSLGLAHRVRSQRQ